jgi:hypothetical protein
MQNARANKQECEVEQNDGRAFEQLVGWIETHFSPQGFKVETRKPVLDDSGVRLAEFDILITGNVGTARVTCLIECRDRPSEGPAPASWIEQLIGRRTRFRLDKVMAVSSTGFAAGAIIAAADVGIELRELQSLSYDDVTHWLPRNAPIIVHGNDIRAVRAFVEDADLAVHVSLDDPVLIGRDSGERQSLGDLWRKLVNGESVWKDIPEGGQPVECTPKVVEHISERYSAEIEGRCFALRDIEFDVTLHAYFPVMPFVEAAEYSTVVGPDGKQTYARVGRWEAPEGSPIRGLTFIGFLKKPEGHGNGT